MLCNISQHLHFHVCQFSTDLSATSILVIVDTNISWSAIVTVGSTNTSGSLALTARPLRSSPSAVFSSNNLHQTLSSMWPFTFDPCCLPVLNKLFFLNLTDFHQCMCLSYGHTKSLIHHTLVFSSELRSPLYNSHDGVQRLPANKGECEEKKCHLEPSL